MYVKDSEAHQLLCKKAELVHTRMVIIQTALQRLLQDGEFVALLRRESVGTIPKVLEQRIQVQP